MTTALYVVAAVLLGLIAGVLIANMIWTRNARQLRGRPLGVDPECRGR